MKTYRKKITKVSKGYRLKPETHKLVNKIQKSINGDRDEAVAAACKAYFNRIDSIEQAQTGNTNSIMKAI